MARGEHKGTYYGWYLPLDYADLAEWFDAEVERRGRGAKSALLTEALADLRVKHTVEHQTPVPVGAKQRQPRRTAKPREAEKATAVTFLEPASTAESCPPHPPARIHKGLCGACGTYVGQRG